MLNDVSKLGLRIGAIKAVELVHNGGWYNTKGEKIGWGDLASEDIPKIQAALEQGEIFVVLSESDSYWNFVTFADSKTVVNPKESNPGLDYLSKKARWLISKNMVWFVTNYETEPAAHLGVTYQPLKREDVKSLLEAAT